MPTHDEVMKLLELLKCTSIRINLRRAEVSGFNCYYKCLEVSNLNIYAYNNSGAAIPKPIYWYITGSYTNKYV